MVDALFVLAAEAAHRSETPFYIVGVLFGVYALVIGTIGMRRPSFAQSRGTGTALLTTSVVLALACGALIIYVLN
jgi:hypothetical protein